MSMNMDTMKCLLPFIVGYYIYYETSDGSNGDKAQLKSPQISVTTGTKCLSFWYYMFGPSVDSLNVYLMQGTKLGSPVFHRERTQGQKWIQATIDITNQQNVQVREATLSCHKKINF